MKTNGSKLESWDLVIIAIYFVIILGIGIWATYKSNRGTVSGYFLAGRFMTWIPIGASLFASNIGSEHFIGLAGSGAAGGFSVGAWTFNGLFLFPILGWVFLPVYIASGICTLPELIHRRLGGQRIRMWLTFIYLLLYVFTKISVNLFSSALFIRLALGWNLYFAIIVVLCITAICMITGGLAAVMYTDTLCTFMMIVGSLLVMGMGFHKVGGYGGLKENFIKAVANDTLLSNSTCGWPGKYSYTMLRGPKDNYMPWPGFFLGDTLTKSLWYWCADQMIVQRLFAAKSFSHAQGGVIFTAYIKILPFFTLVLPGMISRILYAERVACSVPEKCLEICGSTSCSNIAYPELVLNLLPTGLRGLMMAVMIAALMSDLTSIFNSASTLFTIDVYARIRKAASVRELMIVGRMFVILMTIVGVLWIPVVQNVRGEMFVYIQAVASYFSPPLTCLFLASIFWTRCTEKGAFWGLVVGFVVGTIRLILDFAYRSKGCGKVDDRPSIVRDVHYMYFCIILFVCTAIPMIVISLLTEPHPDANLARLTWWTRHDPPSDKDMAEEQRDDQNIIALKDLTEAEETNCNIVNGEKTEENGVNIQFREKKRTKKELLLSWFCGFEEETPEKMKLAEANSKRVEELRSLKQDRKAKIFLNVNAILLYVIGIYLFIYFTVAE